MCQMTPNEGLIVVGCPTGMEWLMEDREDSLTYICANVIKGEMYADAYKGRCRWSALQSMPFFRGCTWCYQRDIPMSFKPTFPACVGDGPFHKEYHFVHRDNIALSWYDFKMCYHKWADIVKCGMYTNMCRERFRWQTSQSTPVIQGNTRCCQQYTLMSFMPAVTAYGGDGPFYKEYHYAYRSNKHQADEILENCTANLGLAKSPSMLTKDWWRLQEITLVSIITCSYNQGRRCSPVTKNNNSKACQCKADMILQFASAWGVLDVVPTLAGWDNGPPKPMPHWWADIKAVEVT